MMDMMTGRAKRQERKREGRKEKEKEGKNTTAESNTWNEGRDVLTSAFCSCVFYLFIY